MTGRQRRLLEGRVEVDVAVDVGMEVVVGGVERWD